MIFRNSVLKLKKVQIWTVPNGKGDDYLML